MSCACEFESSFTFIANPRIKAVALLKAIRLVRRDFFQSDLRQGTCEQALKELLDGHHSNKNIFR